MSLLFIQCNTLYVEDVNTSKHKTCYEYVFILTFSEETFYPKAGTLSLFVVEEGSEKCILNNDRIAKRRSYSQN